MWNETEGWRMGEREGEAGRRRLTVHHFEGGGECVIDREESLYERSAFLG